MKTLLKAAEVLRRHPEIFSRVFLIIGFPHETFRQMRDTYEVSAEMGLDWYQIQVLQPLPNTPIFDEMLEAGLLDVSEFKNVRYSGGTYGRAAKVTEGGRDMLDRDFKSVFSAGDDDEVVPKHLFEDVWAYINFHLNYLKISDETQPIKLRQYERYLGHITDVIAPNDALAHYYLGHIQKTLDGQAEPGTRLASAPVDGDLVLLAQAGSRISICRSTTSIRRRPPNSPRRRAQASPAPSISGAS